MIPSIYLSFASVMHVTELCRWIFLFYYSDQMSQNLLTEMNIAIMSMYLLVIYE